MKMKVRNKYNTLEHDEIFRDIKLRELAKKLKSKNKIIELQRGGDKKE